MPGLAMGAADNGGESVDMDWVATAGPSGRPLKQSRNVKQEVFMEILQRLTEEGHEEVSKPGFADELQAHFARLPARYASDVKKDKACNVLVHKKLLALAEAPENLPVFDVRPIHLERVESGSEKGSVDVSPADSSNSSNASSPFNTNTHPLCAVGSALRLSDISLRSSRKSSSLPRDDPFMYELTFSTVDKPKLLSQLSTILSDVNLNVWEAHIFSTIDGYSLDVFVVYAWATESAAEVERALKSSIALMEEGAWLKTPTASPSSSPSSSPDSLVSAKSPTSTSDDWEIEFDQLKLVKKFSSSSEGDVYRGSFCGQDVTIKVIKPETLNEFVHEISIMRKVRHKNIVQFIGACTRLPTLCIVTEYMAGGSVHDFLRKQKTTLPLLVILKIALDVAKGMDYLHQNKVIHRDLKASSLLMDENEVVKVADFGVARIQAPSGMMTAETGTYRWMAPEVIGHGLYDQKADVYSFGVVVWELLTKKLPYDSLTPFQAAVGVLQGGLRPPIPQDTYPGLANLLERCWRTNPSERPDFSEITTLLKEIQAEFGESSPRLLSRNNPQPPIGFFSSMKRPGKVL